MSLKTIFTLLRVPHLRANLGLTRDVQSFLRLHFLSAAVETGLLDALKTPATKEELAQSLSTERAELLNVLLDLGVSLGELSRVDGHYQIHGRLARALTASDGDPLAAMIQEYIVLHGSAFQHLAKRLHGAPLGDDLEETGALIARSSRILEPFVANFVRDILPPHQPMRLLEIGCGSGVYLRYAADRNQHVTGFGIDLQEAVVKQATANLQHWGIDRRFAILQGDIRNPPAELEGTFDLITLYNNIYYFAFTDRPRLFRDLKTRLKPTGSLALVSLFRGNTISALDFDLVLRSTTGCAPLPDLNELTAQLNASEFSRVQKTQLAPREPFHGILAKE
ncbi:MAG: class I SAM-dependent methyltransferase [Chloroflexota bacterium]|nr:class I SAM-dependent methyltransferase [Chloroflexota bacterium]